MIDHAATQELIRTVLRNDGLPEETARKAASFPMPTASVPLYWAAGGVLVDPSAFLHYMSCLAERTGETLDRVLNNSTQNWKS